MLATDSPGVTELSTLFVSFDVEPSHPYGGHRSASGTWTVALPGSACTPSPSAPRSGQQRRPCVTRSSQAACPPPSCPVNDWKRPEVGRTRLYLDRRSRFLEFDTGAPPAVARGVLDALAAYELVARRG